MSSVSYIALVDCNNFFVSCERLFRPDLIERPVVVLSSNDGCVVSRSNEAKALGFKMGEPYFQLQEKCRTHRVVVFSSNFALYRDLSRRVMHTLRRFSDNVEVYSIDEAFLEFTVPAASRVQENAVLALRAQELRNTILREIGIPVSVGVARTKTLAKVATHLVKEAALQKSGEYLQGVNVLIGPSGVQNALAQTCVEDVWGVGYRLAPQLQVLGIKTAAALAEEEDQWILKRMSVRGLRTVHELRGVRCFPVGVDLSIRQSLLHSQSFGTPLRTQQEVAAAVVHHARKVAETLRSEGVVAREVLVTIRTARHRAGTPYAACDKEVLSVHTNDTLTLVGAANRILSRIFLPGFLYAKAGVMVRDVMLAAALPHQTLFGMDTDARAPLMAALDDIRHRFGGVVHMGSEGIDKAWKAQHTRLSQRYTTEWSSICHVRVPAFDVVIDVDSDVEETASPNVDNHAGVRTEKVYAYTI